MTYIQPGLSLVLLLVLLGLWRRRRWMVCSGWLLLFLWSSPPVARLFMRTLESGYAPSDVPAGEGDVFVVLGGGLDEPYRTQPQALLAESSLRRVMHALWLYKNWRPLPIVVSGGRADDLIVADIMRNVLVAGGVPGDAVWTERRSGSTLANATYTARLLREKGLSRVVLVTHGYHMLRAELCFRKQGMEVIPAPCSLKSILPFTHWRQLLPNEQAIKDNEDILHEWIGLAWYWLRDAI